MKFVKQKHKNGCAVASLAMLSGIGYDKVIKVVHPFYKNYGQPRRYPGVHIEQVLRSMEKLGLQFRVSCLKQDVTKLKNNAIIAVYIAPGSRHAVVWDAKRKKILDPWWKPSKIKITKHYVQKHMAYLAEVLKQ